MKSLLFVLALPLFGFTQTSYNGPAKKAGDQFVGTTPVTLVKHDNEFAAFALVVEDTISYVEMSGTNIGSATIDIRDLLTIHFENGKQAALTPIGLQSFSPSLSGNTYKHRYFIDDVILQELKTHHLTAIRKTMLNDQVEFKLTGQAAREIKKQSLAVADALKKKKRKTTTFSIGVKEMANRIGDSVLLCGTVFITRFFESQKAQAMILDFQTSLSGPKGRAIIWKEDQKKFQLPSPSFFTKKEICVRGVVYLYDGTPYIQISHPDQVTMISSQNPAPKAL